MSAVLPAAPAESCCLAGCLPTAGFDHGAAGVSSLNNARPPPPSGKENKKSVRPERRHSLASADLHSQWLYFFNRQV